MKSRAFTLIELMIVVAILVLLSIVLSLKVINNVQKSKDAVQLSILGTFRSQIDIYSTDNNDSYPVDIITLKDLAGAKTGDKLAQGTSSGAISTFQGEAGTVVKNGIVSLGYGMFSSKNNIVEFYYNSSTGAIYIDGVTNGGTDYSDSIDTKNKKWNEY